MTAILRCMTTNGHDTKETQEDRKKPVYVVADSNDLLN